MPVTLTSEAFGQKPGETYTGPAEAWLVANGYAKNADGADDGDVPDDIAYASSFTVDGDNDNPTDYTGAIKADGLNHLASGGEAVAVLPSDDPTLSENREAPQWPNYVDSSTDFANDADHLNDTSNPNGGVDLDLGGADDDVPETASLTPNEGPAAGGTVVHVNGDNLEGVTSVTFGGTAGTALDVADNENLYVTTPAHAAGTVDVVLVDAAGNETVTGGFTYTA